LVGISGLPGSGKSVTAATLARVLDILGQERGDRAIYLSLDGFHFPNAWLETHMGPDYDGHLVPLRQIKGAPSTFDAAAVAERLARVRAGEESVPFPTYSRLLHDPVPDAVMVTAAHRLIVFEGNYLFLDLPPWPTVRELFDVRLFVETPTPRPYPQPAPAALAWRQDPGGSRTPYCRSRRTQCRAHRNQRALCRPPADPFVR
jgi:pantothenate kinase